MSDVFEVIDAPLFPLDGNSAVNQEQILPGLKMEVVSAGVPLTRLFFLLQGPRPDL